MPGRYGKLERPKRHAARATASRPSRVLRAVVGASVLATIAVGLAVAGSDRDEAAASADSADDAGEPAADLRASEIVSRSSERSAGRIAYRYADVETSESTVPATVVRRDRDSTDGEGRGSDADVKPEATAPLPDDSGEGRRVVYDITGQQVWLVEDGDEVVRTYMVSGSRYDQLDEGTYEVFSKSENAVSWTYSETMRYMVRFHRGENSNIGFHDIPIYDDTGKPVQTLSELGTPLSDGCIRQDAEDAKALWEFAPVGTTVVVVRT